MFGWVSNVVKTVASEAQQFGHNCVESLVGEEDDEEVVPASQTKAESTSAPTSSDPAVSSETNPAVEGNENDKQSEAVTTSATSSGSLPPTTSIKQDEGAQAAGRRKKPQDGDDGSSWAPSELRFVGRHTGKFAGWLVEKSAGVALSLMGEEDDGNTSNHPKRNVSNASDDQTKESALSDLAQAARTVDSACETRNVDGDPSSAAKKTTETPLAVLRACRGYLGMLKRQQQDDSSSSATASSSRPISVNEIESILLLSFPSEFDFSEELDRECSWIASTTTGEAIELIRKEQSVSALVERSTGAPLHGESAIASLDRFPTLCTDLCDQICEVVVSELAKLFARPNRQLSSTLHDLLAERRHDEGEEELLHGRPTAKWYLHRRTDAHGVHLNLTAAEHLAKNVMDLVSFALCEMHRGCESVCKVIQDAAAWARRSNHPETKPIKEQSMRTRGECLSANVNAVVQLEEALEITKMIFPSLEGVAPLEPLQVGQPMEFVRDPTVTVATEHGNTVVVAGDRHERTTPKKAKDD